MRVVADSHALIFYLFLPDRLTQRALGTLGEAEDSGGVVVSAATLGDLWYASHKSGPRALAPGAYESLRRTVLDPATNFEVAGITAETMEHFDRVPLADRDRCRQGVAVHVRIGRGISAGARHGEV